MPAALAASGGAPPAQRCTHELRQRLAQRGCGSLTAANAFADQAEMLIKSRQASDALGATKMDRPEWLAIDPNSGWVDCTLTNNSSRGQPTFPGIDAANPRANNVMGQIIRWQDERDFGGLAFKWNHLVLAGDPASERPEGQHPGRYLRLPRRHRLRFARRAVDPHRHGPPAMNKGEMVRTGNTRCWPAT